VSNTAPITNTSDDCSVTDSESGKTAYMGATNFVDPAGNSKSLQVLAVEYPNNCRFYFGRIINTGNSTSDGSFFLLGRAVVQNNSILVSYTPYGENPAEISAQLLRDFKDYGPAADDHLPVRLTVSSLPTSNVH
jgi:hypothetical protein